MAHNGTDLVRADRHVAEGMQRVADQRARIADKERNGLDQRLSESVLKNLETSLRLMIQYRDQIRLDLAPKLFAKE
jgi:hypothetical protein